MSPVYVYVFNLALVLLLVFANAFQFLCSGYKSVSVISFRYILAIWFIIPSFWAALPYCA